MTAEEIFLAAVEKTPPDRVVYLDAACGTDAKLRARVEALLRSHEEAGSLLDQPLFRPGPTVDQPRAIEETGAVIGPYKLLQQIGEGGMGKVYMAEQTKPVQRKVALKLIKPGMDSRQVIARFEAERQALALMDHPHIAKVLDAGTTEGGRPYFVMELVKGVPITKYCDERRLTPKQRLELFVPVCQAVQHAHQKGVIHRDLKPSNVLVAEYDDTPVVKVIDFGVAKATGTKLTERTMFTELGQVVGTLEYMSPEQAKLNALDIDTRSDIYALGVLLYELLTGTTPLDKKRLQRAAFDEMLRIIREEEPPKPSTRLSDSKDSLPSISAQRHTDPAKLTKLVCGELDWIVMKALEKDRARRYETANGFARDIERYLADEPVEACPPSAGYKLRKFARKNRKALVTAGAFLVLLGVAAVVSTWQAIRALDAETAANASAERARLNAVEAEHNAQQARNEANAKDLALKAEQQARADETKARQQAFAALRSMTAGVVEKKFAQGTVLTEDDRAFLRSVIAQYDAFASIKGDDADSRALRAEGRWRVGTMRHGLGELQEAERDFDQAVGIYNQLASDFPNRPEFIEHLADCHNNRGLLLQDTGRLPDAEKDFNQALNIYQKLAADFSNRPEFHQRLAGSHLNRGQLLSETGRLNEAEIDYGQALSIQKQLAADFPARPEFRYDVANSYNNRGILLKETGRPQEAEKDYDQALSIHKQLAADFPARPEFRLALAGSHNNLGFLLSAMGRPQEAEKDYDQALSIHKQLAADFPTRPEFRLALAGCHNNRGNLLCAAGRPQEAEKDFGQALAIQKQLVSDIPTRPEFRHALAMSHTNRGPALSDMDRLKEAEQDYDQALGIYKHLAADFANQSDLRNDVAATCVNLALLFWRQGNLTAAKRLLLEGRPHHLAALKANPRHPTYRQFYRNHLRLLIEVYAGLLEQADAVRTAETYRDLGWDAPADAYDAASLLSRCIPIVAQHDKLDDKQRNEATQFYGDAATKLLREAADKGFGNGAHMLQDTN
jgi:serine/threonine protein kinase/Tfp pilus assembly protein PilF